MHGKRNKNDGKNLEDIVLLVFIRVVMGGADKQDQPAFVISARKRQTQPGNSNVLDELMLFYH